MGKKRAFRALEPIKVQSKIDSLVPLVVVVSRSGNCHGIKGTETGRLAKDIGLALNWANRARLHVPMAALIRERYSQARAQGWGGEDCTAIVNLVKDLGRLA